MRWCVAIGASVVLLVGCDRHKPPTEPVVAAPAPTVQDGSAASDEPAAASPTPPPGPSPHELAAKDLLKTVEALGALHRAKADDCAALADALASFHREHGAALAGAEAQTLAWIDANDDARARMRSAMGSVMTVSMKCRDDSAFVATQEALFDSDAR